MKVCSLEDGTVRFVYTIVPGLADLDAISGEVGAEKLTTGVKFTKVDGTHVYVIGNKTIPLSTGDNLFTKLVLPANRLNKDNLGEGDFSKVVLYGNGSIKEATTETPNLIGSSSHYAEVTIAPLSSRIEIKQINQTNAKYTYNLEGIFVTNYNQEMMINAVEGDELLNYGQDATKYTDANYGGEGTSTWHDMISASTPINPYTPGANKVWAYNVFPAKNKTTPTVEDNIPTVIVHLKDVKVGDEVKYANYYLTVSSYNSGVTPITAFEAGKVYTIDNIEFDIEKNGDVIPDTKKFNCDVKITNQAWTAVPVTVNVE